MKFSIEERRFSFLKWVDRMDNKLLRARVSREQSRLKSPSLATRVLAESRKEKRDSAREERRNRAKSYSLKLS